MATTKRETLTIRHLPVSKPIRSLPASRFLKAGTTKVIDFTKRRQVRKPVLGCKNQPSWILKIQERVALQKAYAEAHRPGRNAVCSAFSYAAIAKDRCTPSPLAISGLPKPKPFIKPVRNSLRLQRRECFILNKTFKEEALKERQMFRELAEAIAKRATKVLYVAPEKRKRIITPCVLPVREVTEFGKKCYWPKPTLPVEHVKVQIVDAPKPALPTSVKQVKRPYSYVTSEYGRQNQKQIKRQKLDTVLDNQTIDFLLFKLKMQIWSFRNPEKVASFYDSLLSSNKDFNLFEEDNVVPQMDADPVTPEAVTQDIKSNVAIVSNTVKADVDSSLMKASRFSNLAISRENQEFTTLADRWLLVQTKVWNTSDIKDTILSRLAMPYDIIRNDLPTNFSNTQMAQLFYLHRLFRFDLDFKIVLNASPWQSGMLVIDFMYGTTPDKRWDNYCSALQRTHAKLKAGSSNNVELSVKYQNCNSFMSNKNNKCIMGILSVRVMNPLYSVDGISSSATYSIYVSVPNIEAHGLVSRNVGLESLSTDGVQGQMDVKGLCNLGSNTLTTIGDFFNRDNPPLPLQPSSMILQTAPSFSYTDFVPEPVNMLRADPRGQRVNSVVTNEMTLQYMLSIWGLINTYSWAFSDISGSTIITLLVKPKLNASEYTQLQTTIPDLMAVCYPPVAVMSSLAAKCRGDLEFKFEIVANAFYTGMLQISAIPLDDSDERLLTDTSLSISVNFDISKSSEIVVRIPWNWYNAWMRTSNHSNRAGNSYAKLYVKVVNPLIAIDRVPPAVRINLYVRGADNFELAQYKAPTLALLRATLQPVVGEEILVREANWGAFYVGRTSDIKPSSTYNGFQCLRQGVAKANIVCSDPKTPVRFGAVYHVDPISVLGYPVKMTKWSRQEEGEDIEVEFSYLVTHKDLWHSNADQAGFLPVQYLVNAQTYRARYLASADPSSQAFVDNILDSDERIRDFIYIKEGAYAKAQKDDGEWVKFGDHIAHDRIRILYNPEDQTFKSAFERQYSRLQSSTSTEFTYIYPQMDTTPIITVEDPTPTTSMGKIVYGESMPDLKSMGRRWHIYSSFTGNSTTVGLTRDMAYLFKLPVKLQRPLDILASTSYDNRVRDGFISLMNGAFFLWEGSLRFRLVFTHTIPEDTVVYIQHKIDDEAPGDYVIHGPGHPLSLIDYMDPLYPTYVQTLSVNPIVTVEVPYQRSEERLLTGGEPLQQNNGWLYVWVNTPNSESIKCTIYYSFADDTAWSVFQGMPPMVDLYTIPDEGQGPSLEWDNSDLEDDIALPQMDEDEYLFEEKQPVIQSHFEEQDKQNSRIDKLYTKFKKMGKKKEPTKNVELVDVQPQIWSIFTPQNEIKEAMGEVANAAITINSSAETITQDLTQLKDRMHQMLDNLEGIPAQMSDAQKVREANGNVSNFLGNLKAASFDYITHVVYCIMHPAPTTVSWAIVNLYRNIFGMTLDGIAKITTPLINLWNRATRSTEQTQVEGQMENEDLTSLCSLIYCSMCTMLKMKTSHVTSWEGLTKGLFQFGDTCRVTGYVAKFFKDNFELFRRIWRKFLSYFSTDTKNFGLISGVQDERLKQWLVHSSAMTNPAIQDKLCTNPRWGQKIFELCIVGRAIVLSTINDPAIPQQLMRLITSTMTSLKKVEQILVNQKIFSGDRYEPYCVWITGSAGVGKTRLGHQLADELAIMVNSSSPQTYHPITTGQQYFDGFKGQPSIMMDDFFSLSIAQDPSSVLFLQLKSSAQCNPPYSAVEDKSRTVNFENLIVTSNFISASGLPGVHCTDAFDRRRDTLLRMNKDYKRFKAWSEKAPPRDTPEYDAAILKAYSELEFVKVFYYSDPLKTDNFGVEIPRTDEIYYDTVWRHVRADAERYHQRETLSYQQRCRDKIRRLERIDLSGESVEVYLESCLQAIYTENFIKNGNFVYDYKAAFATWLHPILPKTDISLVGNIQNEIVQQSNLPKSKFSVDEACGVDLTKIATATAEEAEAALELLDQQKKSEVKVKAVVEKPQKTMVIRNSAAKLKSPVLSVPDKVVKTDLDEITVEVQPQGHRTPIWPTSKDTLSRDELDMDQYRRTLTCIHNVDEYVVIEPQDRGQMFMGTEIFPTKTTCLHDWAQKIGLDKFIWNSEVGCYDLFETYSVGKREFGDAPTSFSIGPCRMRIGDEIVVSDACRLVSASYFEKFKADLVSQHLKDDPQLNNAFCSPEIDAIDAFSDSYYQPWLLDQKTKSILSGETLKVIVQNELLTNQVLKLQKTLVDNNIEVSGVIIPKRPRWKTICIKVWNAFIKTISVIAKVIIGFDRIVHFIALVGFIGLGASSVYSAWKGGKEYINPQIHPSGDFKTIRARGTMKARHATLLNQGQSDYPKEISLDENGLISDDAIRKACEMQVINPDADGRMNKILNNMFYLCGIRSEDGKDDVGVTYRGRCIGLHKYSFLIPKHYIDHFEKLGCNMYVICYRGGKGIQRFSPKDIKFQWTESGEGYGVGTFPRLAMPFSDIRKFIPSESFDGNYPAQMYMVEPFNNKHVIHTIDTKRVKEKIVHGNATQKPWVIKGGFEYPWGGSGRCGSFLFCPQLACPLVGIHTAGREDKVGYSELLLRETFEDPEEMSVDFVAPQMIYDENKTDLPGDGLIIGHLPPNKSVNLPNKTKIAPSIIHGVFPVTTQPAPLSRLDERIVDLNFDPLEEGLKKRCDAPEEYPEDLLNAAYVDMSYKFKHIKPLRNPGKLTLTEAIEGIELPGYEPLELRTSEGYPWVLDRPDHSKDKSWLFKFEEKQNGRRKLVGIHPKLYENLIAKEKMRAKGKVPATYYTVCLKDSRIPIEKIRQPGKTRMFEMSPVDLTIPQRQYYLDFYCAYQASRMDAENTIGINPDGPEWTDLANRLTEFSPYILTGDFSGYGPRLSHAVQFKSYLLQAGWYAHHQEQLGMDPDEIDEEFQTRYTMTFELLNPLNVVKNLVCAFDTGMPSGNAGTVIQNSACNSLQFRIIYLWLARKYAPHLADLYHFKKFVLLFSNGDDVILAVKEAIISWFNNKTLIEAFAEFGIKMTDALKSDGEVREHCSITEATYLKRGFLPHPNRQGEWLAPLEEKSITDTANWIWKCPDEKLASLVNSEMSCRLAYTHGPQLYSKICTKLRDAWISHGVDFQTPSWYSLDSHVWEGTESPSFDFDF